MKNSNLKLIHKSIKKFEKIYIMGHIDLDLDAIGGCVAIAEISKHYKKNPYIIINDKRHESGVKKILSMIKDKFSIVKSKDIMNNITENDLLIVVDVNKANFLQDNDLLNCFKNVLVIDHHEKNDYSIKTEMEAIDNKSSSTCEILTKYIYYYNMSIPYELATFLLAGIVLDTNDFSIKTTGDTYYCAYYLSKIGADNKEVQFLLKQDIDEYIIRQRVITDVQVLNKRIAFAVGSTRIKYKREDLAKIADTLLEFNQIDMSFVIGKLDNDVIGISGRSIGKGNVGDILSKLGGGGDKHEAAARIEGKSLKEVEDDLKHILR